MSPSAQAQIGRDFEAAFVDAFRMVMFFALAQATVGALTAWLVIPRPPAQAPAREADPATVGRGGVNEPGGHRSKLPVLRQSASHRGVANKALPVA